MSRIQKCCWTAFLQRMNRRSAFSTGRHTKSSRSILMYVGIRFRIIDLFIFASPHRQSGRAEVHRRLAMKKYCTFSSCGNESRRCVSTTLYQHNQCTPFLVSFAQRGVGDLSLARSLGSEGRLDSKRARPAFLPSCAARNRRAGTCGTASRDGRGVTTRVGAAGDESHAA